MLKNAKDAAATEALEIATYTALERLAPGAGDDRTAKLAASIRADEERMLERVLGLIPALTDAVAAADLHGEGTYKVAETGAADAVRSTARSARTTRRTATTGRPSGRAEAAAAHAQQARQAPGAARAEGASRAQSPTSRNSPIARDHALDAPTRSSAGSPGSWQVDLGTIKACERKNQSRTTHPRPGSRRSAGTNHRAGFDGETDHKEIRRPALGRRRRTRRRPSAVASARASTAQTCSARRVPA